MDFKGVINITPCSNFDRALIKLSYTLCKSLNSWKLVRKDHKEDSFIRGISGDIVLIPRDIAMWSSFLEEVTLDFKKMQKELEVIGCKGDGEITYVYQNSVHKWKT